MNCDQFRERHAEFRDGLITAPREARRMEGHLAHCAECRRYDTSLRRGVLALQGVDTIEPSPNFRRRLDARLRSERLRLAEPPLRARAGLAAALFVAAALTLVAVEGLHSGRHNRLAALPPVPFPKPVAQAGVPFVTFQDPRASVVTGNPNPYGTALVQPASARPEPATAGR
jgi:putative zinc finger protein